MHFLFIIMTTNKLPLSVVLISYNEESNIGRTLQSVANISSEIILVDSFSTDRTVEIAESFGAKIFKEDWKGYVEQKNSALRKSTQSWILALDCDEVPDEVLINAISNVIEKNERIGYLIQRKTFYLGKLMKRAWQPDWKLRLVRRDCNPRWEGIEPHDVLVVDSPVKKIKGSLIHYPYRDLYQHFQKTIKYAKISADAYYKLGLRANLFKICFNPLFAFIKLYFLNLGLVDGLRGFIAGVSSLVATFLKYVFLWEIEKGSKK
ncbi:MAG: glycosyltransferase family 2 protein [Candidatus Kapaibacteriota bacterium]